MFQKIDIRFKIFNLSIKKKCYTINIAQVSI